jgi:hypothetical protein
MSQGIRDGALPLPKAKRKAASLRTYWWYPPMARQMAVVSIRLLAVAAVGSAVACTGDRSASNQEPAAAVSATHQSAEVDQRLKAIEASIAEAERRAAVAKEDARFYECKASVERVTAESRAEQAACMGLWAAQSRCAAEVERRKGDTSLAGAVFGFAIAVASGGAAAPWALGGALFGRTAAEGSAAECPAPECVERFDAIHQTVMRRSGWDSLPLCGGRLGVYVETPALKLVGGALIREPGRLAAMGLQRGDFIAYVNGERVTSGDAFLEALRRATNRAGSSEVRFVRAERLLIVHLPLGTPVDASQVGTSEVTQHRYGARIARTEDGEPRPDGLDAGDTIFALDGTEIVSADHLRDLIRYRRAGESVDLTIHRRDRAPRQVTLALVAAPDAKGM